MVSRLFAIVGVSLVAFGLLVLAWPQLFELQREIGIAQVVAFRAICAGLAACALVLLALLALLTRRVWPLGISLVCVLLAFTVANTAILWQRGFENTAFPAAKKGDLIVMSWNTLGEATGAQAIADLAISSNASIVSLPETTQPIAVEVALIMKAQGHPMYVHTVSFGRVAKSRSTSVLTSPSIGRYHLDDTVRSTVAGPTVVIAPDSGTGPVIVGAHPIAPVPRGMPAWRRDLGLLATLCSRDNVIMAGDFNSTLDHLDGFASLPTATVGRCADAALASHSAGYGTWPTSVPATLGATIDHVMATPNWRVTAFRVVQTLDHSGSDHRPIIAQLSPTP